MWNIHGKVYDLEPFLNTHPGGKAILESCKGTDDLTASFESYHAFCDMKKIKNIMEKYEISICNSPVISFKSNGFYRILQQRVITSLQSTKSDWWWCFKVIVQIFIYSCCFFIAFYFHSISPIYRTFSAIIAGNVFIQIGFCAMHDASHMAISKMPYVNERISNIWNSVALWDSQLWTQHHVIRHHAFTGDFVKDPDTINLKPFIRKSTKISNTKYWNISNYPIFTSLFTICIFPGMFFGQGYLYNFVWLKKTYLWNIKISDLYKISFWQTLIKIFMLCSFIYGGSILIFLLYAISANTTYAMCILPDHDTFDTNNIHSEYTHNKDWGEIQVRNSGNFSTQNPLICYLFGGINYQIEHHLFPTLCHIHLPKIKSIVKQTCKEFGIPYTHHNSIYSAVCSTLKQYSICSKEVI